MIMIILPFFISDFKTLGRTVFTDHLATVSETGKVRYFKYLYFEILTTNILSDHFKYCLRGPLFFNVDIKKQ